jgi:hypothetical protein
MSLGDHLRYLRAVHQVDRDYIMAAVGEPYHTIYWLVERKYTDISDDVLIERLAAFYKLPVEELQWHRARSRKALGQYIAAAIRSGQSVKLRLRNGDTHIGRPVWCDHAALGLEVRVGDPLIVVQRHAVIDWAGASG